jgi:hypothetical protein
MASPRLVSFGALLKRYRLSAGLTQEDLADGSPRAAQDNHLLGQAEMQRGITLQWEGRLYERPGLLLP